MTDEQREPDETTIRPEDPNATHTNLPGSPAGGGDGGAGGITNGGITNGGVTNGGGSSSGARLKRRNQRAATVAIVLLVAIVGGLALATTGSGSDKASAAEITRESFDSTGSNPFTGTVVVPDVTIPKTIPNVPGAPTFPPKLATSGSIATIPAGTPGLYGGTQQLSVCDVKQLVSFLQSNTDKAAAWAKVVSIAPAEIPSYVAELTSVILRSDTRVTNHGFANGAATPLQSVLQAGTAVLVDKFGVPRVRCYCGNPLTLPEPVTPTYQGSTWDGFDPGRVTVIQPSPTPIINIVLINIVDGSTFQRPVGTTGGTDVKVTLRPGGSTTSTTPKGTTTTTKPQPTTSTTTAAGAAQAAIKVVHDGLAKCVADLKAQGQLPNETNVDVFKYSADPLGGSAYNVKVIGADGTAQGNWRVDTKTGAIVPTDQTASEVGSQCPGLA